MSLAAELPTICITHDTRTRELCDIMKVPQVASTAIHRYSSVSDLFEEVKFDGDLFEENRSDLAKKFLELISAAGCKASSGFRYSFCSS